MRKSLGAAVRTDDPCLPHVCMYYYYYTERTDSWKNEKTDVVLVNPVFQFKILNTMNSEQTHSLCRFQKRLLLQDTESYVPESSHFFLQPFLKHL
jgi:hypothetical protein